MGFFKTGTDDDDFQQAEKQDAARFLLLKYTGTNLEVHFFKTIAKYHLVHMLCEDQL